MFRLLWLIPIAFIVSACPFESPVPLEKAPIEPIDSSLLGYWYGIVNDGSDFFGIEALDITKESDSTYSITRYGKAAKGDIILPDTAYFTGYTSYVGDQHYMNIESSIVIVNARHNKEPEIKTEKVYYLAQFERHHDTLRLKTISENFYPGRKEFKSPDALKKLITSLQDDQANIYDDLYSLDYRKIQRPATLKSSE